MKGRGYVLIFGVLTFVKFELFIILGNCKTVCNVIFICATGLIISKVLPTPPVFRHRILVPYVPLRVWGSANVPAYDEISCTNYHSVNSVLQLPMHYGKEES